MKRIDQYLCIDFDKLIIDEMNEIIDNDSSYILKEDREYWKELKESAMVVRRHYTV